MHDDLGLDIGRWLANGGSLGHRLAAQIELEALFQQRLYRKLVADERLARATFRMLDGGILPRAEANHSAGSGLSSGLVPVSHPVKLKTTRPVSPHRLLALYESAERSFRIPWEVLAAVNFVETRFGRVLGPSSAGALGPMQFLLSTWERYGKGGDILDPRDSIFAAARYLRASGGPENLRGAVFNYNRSDAYVDAVLTYARQMKRSPRAFYQYYFWQVFVRTTKGDAQLTGPGTANPFLWEKAR